MGERGYWTKEQNKSENDPKAAFSIQREKQLACSRLKKRSTSLQTASSIKTAVVHLGSETTSLNTTQKSERFLEGKNGSTLLQNVAFVAEHFWSLQGHYEVTTLSLRSEFGFMNGSSFDSRFLDHFVTTWSLRGHHAVTTRSPRFRFGFGFMNGLSRK